MKGKIEASTRRAYVGKTGTGKSYAAKADVADYLKRQGARVVVFDPEDEWSKHGEKSQHINLGPCTHRTTFEEFAADPGRWLDFERVSLAVVPSEDEDEAAEQVAEFVSIVRSTGDLLVVFEEVGSYAGPEAPNKAGAKALAKIATRGRHWGCPVFFCAQFMIQIPPGARRQVGELQCFRQTTPADLAALEELVGDPTLADRVKRLPDRESIEWRDARGGSPPAPEGEDEE